MKLAPPVIPTSLKGGSRIVARVETVAKGANVDAVVTDWGVAEFRGCTLNLIDDCRTKIRSKQKTRGKSKMHSKVLLGRNG